MPISADVFDEQILRGLCFLVDRASQLRIGFLLGIQGLFQFFAFLARFALLRSIAAKEMRGKHEIYSASTNPGALVLTYSFSSFTTVVALARRSSSNFIRYSLT